MISKSLKMSEVMHAWAWQISYPGQIKEREIYMHIVQLFIASYIQLAAKVLGHLAILGVKWLFSRGRGGR